MPLEKSYNSLNYNFIIETFFYVSITSALAFNHIRIQALHLVRRGSNTKSESHESENEISSEKTQSDCLAYP